MSTRSNIVEAIFRLKPRGGQFSIENLALLTFTERSKTPSLAEQEYVSKYRQAIFSSVLQRQDDIVEVGGLETFKIVPTAPLRLMWLDSSPKSSKHRERLKRRACVARWLDDLGDRPYEFASAYAMQVLGASRIHITPAGSEFGIDFLALIPAYTRSPAFLSGLSGLRVVGQSKKYNSAVPLEKIQSFDACLAAVRNNKAELLDIIPPWFRGSPAPILSCFVAHSGFQSGSARLAQQGGHITLDTIALAEIISRPDIIGSPDDELAVHRKLWSKLHALGMET